MNFVALAILMWWSAPLAELVDVSRIDPRWVIAMPYATADNFVGEKLYSVERCLLRPEPAKMLVLAQEYLDQHQPGYVLIFKDCYRPLSIQQRLWAKVKGTPQAAYVANPNSKTGSIHNYGAAVDVTLLGPDGQEVDMGTPYDHLGILSEPRHEERFAGEGKLTAVQLKNRTILRTAMRQAGFRSIANEWWHFEAFSKKEILKRYTKLDLPLLLDAD